MPFKLLLPRVFALLPLVILAGCGGAAPPGGAAAGGAGRGAFAVPVEIVTLAPKPIDDAVDFVGVVKSRRSTVIQPQAEGLLTAIRVKSGDRVQPGTLMFEIDATSQQAAVGSLESIRGAREADAAFARQQADRAKSLLQVGAMSQQEHEQALTQQKTAEAQLNAVLEQIRQQRAELAFYRVVASTAGVVGDIPVRVGERVTRGTQLTTVDDTGGLELYVNVPVEQAAKLKTGLTVHLLNDAGESTATEKIDFVSPSVDETQTVLVKAPLTARDGAFRTEQFVRTRLVFASAPGLTVPLVAATRINGQFFVFVAEAAPAGQQGLVAHQRPITVGAVVGNEYVVRSGLAAGDKLIVSGIQKIGDGAPVQAAPPGPPAAAGRGGA